MPESKLLLGTLLKERRLAEGYSLRKLAHVVGVSFATLSRIERGEGEPDNNTRIRVLEWLGEDAKNVGLDFQNVALVHFRARKYIDSETTHALLKVAEFLMCTYQSLPASDSLEDKSNQDQAVSLSKREMEKLAGEFRKDLKVSDDSALDEENGFEPLNLRIEGVEILSFSDINEFDPKARKTLTESSSNKWDAMSVPIGESQERWIIFRNTKQSLGRQRVSLMEEVWHILLGHRLTRIAKVADVYGRTFDEIEEHDAYYLASATMLPEKIVRKFVSGDKKDPKSIARRYGVTPALVEYRIKRLGLWRQYKGLKVSLK